MQARTALIAAIVSGALAIGVVAVDVIWTLEARFDTRDGDAWKTVAQAPTNDYRAFPHLSCANPEMRFVVHNDKPFSDNVRIAIDYYDTASGRTVTVLRETWRLDAFEERTHEFTLPDDAFRDPNVNQSREKPLPVSVQVSAQVDDLWLSACVEQEATQ